MSFNALPEELLEEIFSYLGGKQRMEVSLVNRHWFRILSTPRFTRNVKLRLNKQRAGFIPINLLLNSVRMYQHIYFSITDASDTFVQLIVGDLLQQCAQRWNVQSLEIDAYYGRLLLFLQVNRHLLEGLRALYIKVEHSHRHEAPSHGVPIDDTLVLQLKSLEVLHWSYGASDDDHHILSFVTPQLKRLEMRQFPIQPRILGPMMIAYTSLDVGSTLSNLQELYLCGLYVNLDEYQLELPHVRKLTLESIVARDSLMLTAPSLIELITDFRSINAIQLVDANALSHVEFHLCRECQDDYLKIYSEFMTDPPFFLEDYAHQVTALTLISHADDMPFENFSLLLDNFPSVESLHLHQFSLPNYMDERGPLLKKILLTNCSTQARDLWFPSGIESVTVYRLQTPRGDFCFFPNDLNEPQLESVDIPARWYHLTAKTVHSTRGFRYRGKGDGDGASSMAFRNHNHKELNVEGAVWGPEVEIVSE